MLRCRRHEPTPDLPGIEMGFRFRRSVRLFPGVRLNFGLRGVSVSAGVPGMTVNIGSRRSSITVGIPGTGLSYTETLAPGRQSVRTPPPLGDLAVDPPAAPVDRNQPGGALPGEIRSAEVAALTSPDLEGLKNLINEAAHQKASLQPDWLEAVNARKKAWKKLRRREQLPLKLFMKQAIPKARETFDEAENEATKVAEALAASEIKVEVVLDDRCWAAWSRLERAHRRLSNSARFWDVTSSLVVDRFRTRSAASFEVTRTLVGLRPITDGILSGPHRGMRFENANGDDLDIFPGFLLIRQKQGTDYALVDLRDLETRSYPQQFIEAEGVPPDARVVGHAWAKSNKDGSPDRRFRDNHQIPVALYGRIEFATSTGVREAYDASDCEAALEFGEALRTLQAELRRHAADPRPVQVASPGDQSPSDRTIALPALPDVWPAYEVLLIPLALAGAMAIPFSVPRPVVGPAGPSIAVSPVPATLSAPIDEATTKLTQPPAPTREGSTTITKSPPSPMGEPAGRGEPASVGPSPPDVRGVASDSATRRMVTTTGANVRAEPDRGSPSTRVVAAGTSVVVFEKKNGWVRVGSSASEPWGWIHSSLLAAVP